MAVVAQLGVAALLACSSDDASSPVAGTADAGSSSSSGGSSSGGAVDGAVGAEAGGGLDAAAPPSGWPGPSNTGVPAGTTLTKYTGSCDLRKDGEVIEEKTFECGILVYAKNVVIRRSKITGLIKTNAADATLTLEDVEVDGGDDQSEAVGGDNVTVLRSNVYGNQHSVHCGSHCVVKDSWLHDQHDGKAADWHQNGFLSNGGTDFTIEHNTVACVGGCTADIAFINDDDVSNGTITNNLLVASPDSAFCAYPFGSTTSKPGKVSNMVWKDNVFQRGGNQKCGTYGPVYEFSTKNGNVWSNNTWENGSAITE